MSFIAMCPAPFQKPKKKVKSKSKVVVETPLPPLIDHLLARNLAQQRSQDHLAIARSQLSSSHHHHHNHVQCSIAESGSQQSAPGSSTSNDSHSTHTSGYQTDDGTFEGKLLKRANRSRPANLRMTAIRDYTPCCHEELAVRRGQRVKVLYKNNDWVYAVTKSGETGYIPYSFVRPSRKYAGYQSEPEYCQDTDTYRSGYDTDLPVSGGNSRRHGHRTQICDVVPTYSVHTGFRGHPSPEMKGKSYHVSPHMDQQRRHQHQHISGYTSAVEYHSESDSRYRPRPAKSLHSILDASSPPSVIREYRPAERKPELDSFKKELLEELVVIHDFEAQEEDEVFIGKGERVKVLNAVDPFWLWVETTPGDQGFVPRTCCSLGNHPSLQNNRSGQLVKRSPNPATSSRHAKRYYERSRTQLVARQARSQAKQRFHELARLRNNPQNPVLMDKEEIQRVGSKLIVLMDYTATQKDELSIKFAETVFADVLKQAGAERIWAYCPRTEKCGFVPVSLVVPPVV